MKTNTTAATVADVVNTVAETGFDSITVLIERPGQKLLLLFQNGIDEIDLQWLRKVLEGKTQHEQTRPDSTGTRPSA